MKYLLHLLIYLDIYVIVSLGLNLAVGYNGLLTLAHGAYFAVGAYAYALLSLKLGVGFLPGLLAAAVLCALLSGAISVPAWRFRGDYFVLISLAVQALLFGAIHNWVDTSAEAGSWSNLTNGPFGLAGIPQPAILGIHMDTQARIFSLSAALAVLALVGCWVLSRSPWGLVLKAARDDELATRSLGKNVRLAKTEVLAISCALAGVGGALYASYASYLHPSVGSLDQSILFLTMVVVGGAGNLLGPIVGAFVILMIPEILRLVVVPDAVAGHVQLLVYGLLLILLMRYRPQGIAGTYRLQ